jgi:hypothetical protein
MGRGGPRSRSDLFGSLPATFTVLDLATSLPTFNGKYNLEIIEEAHIALGHVFMCMTLLQRYIPTRRFWGSPRFKSNALWLLKFFNL